MATGVAVAAATSTAATAIAGRDDGLETRHAMARQFIAAMVESIVDGRTDRSRSIADRIWAGRSTLRPTSARIAALNAALVLLAEHELATSTLAVRVAASTRVGLDGILLTGLGTLGGPLHGQVSDLIHGYLVARRRGSKGADVDVELVRKVAFGHPVHQTGDPRAAVMLERVTGIATPADLDHLDAARAVLGGGKLPNVDFALAALAYVGRMSVGSAGATFAIARAAGWVAHALEEYQERPLRYRGRALSRTGRR
jgi:citrate synthase